MKQNVLFGFLGSTRDAGDTPERWEKWRPTIALGVCDDLRFDRFEIFYDTRFQNLLEIVTADFQVVSPQTTVVPNVMSFDDPWDFEEVYAKLFDFLQNYRFDLEREEYYTHIKTGSHVCQICMFLLNESLYLPGKIIQTFPPRPEYPDEKNVGSYKIIDLNLAKYEQIATRFAREKVEAATFLKSGIATRNPTFNALIEQIEWVALRAREPILLTGGTGVGKSLLAKRIHELKKLQSRLTGPFVAVNAATLRGEQAMSTLFGHKKGAFTGAASDRAGLLLTANQGLLFLDEIGELGLDEQAMLLRAIEEKQFLPVGCDTDVTSDFQLIAATNHDLNAAVAAGTFREDLLARINLWTFRLPGLTERREDIEPNIDFELTQYAVRYNRNITFNKEARDRFVAFAVSPEATWNANFRDLNAAITRMATFSHQGRIRLETVEQEITRLTTQWHSQKRDPTDAAYPDAAILDTLPGELASRLDRFDAVQLAEVIRVCRNSKSLAEAGRRLFEHSRQKKKSANDSDRLKKYLGGFGLDWDSVTESCDY